MRFSQRTRRWAIRLAWAGLLVTGSLLAGLRLGRPLYYTDGSQQVAASSLPTSGMVRWNTPEAIVELPGPVTGRVAALPDGRLVYGRTLADGTADLVVFDPTRPQVPPEPAYGLNTPHNELAPAVGADGSLYFASDRPEGLGGYDLYVAAFTAAGFAAPQPVTICNTALDETDPAPAPGGDELVFVRIDRRIADGRGGELWQVRLDGVLDPVPVWQPPTARRTVVADRDPAFAPGGSALWFVRQQGTAPPELLRASRLDGRFDTPCEVGAAWATRALRAPLPSADGLHLGLLQPRHGDVATDLWLRADAEELPPWWPGQRWLEGLLLGAAAVFAVLLLLLHLGRRWSTMDFVAQCLLLSLLLHALLFLWLMGVEIQGQPLPGDDAAGRLQVMVVSDLAAAAVGGGAPQPADVAARATFAIAPQPLALTPPPAAPEAAARSLAVASSPASWQQETLAGAVQARTELQDRGAEPERRRCVVAEVEPSPAALPAVARAVTAAVAAQAAERAGAKADVVAIVVPTAALAPATAPARLLTAARAVPLATAAVVVAPAPPMQDQAAVLPGRDAEVRPASVDAASNSVAEAAAVPPALQRAGPAEPAAVAATAPGAGPLPLAATPIAAPPQLAAAAPAARAHTAAAQVQDAPRHVPSAEKVGTLAAPTAPPAAVALAPVPAQVFGVATARPAAGDAKPATVTAPPTALAAAGSRAAPPAPLPPGVALGGTPPRAAAVALRDRPAAEPVASAVVAVNPKPSVAGAADALAVAAPGAPHLADPVRGAQRPAAVPGAAPPWSQLTRQPAAADVLRAGAAVPPAPPASVAAAPANVRLRDLVAGAAALAADRRPPALGEPQPLAAEPLGAPAAGAAVAVSPLPVARTLAVVAEPPGSTLGRVTSVAGMTSAATARGAALVVRPQRPTPPGSMHDGSRTATMRAAAAQPPPRVLAAAVRIDPAPVYWPAARRAPLASTPRDTSFAPVPPRSLLDRPQTTASLPLPAVPNAPATAYSNRFGPAKARALETFGGSEATERAVADGLRYLARRQHADGTWGDRSDFDAKYGRVYVGKTALCVLAFLGAGHTPDSHSEYSDVVKRAIDHLLSTQDPDTGAFGASSCYGHGITTYALAECYGLTKAPALVRPLEDALVWILQNQGPRRDRRNRGGWGYFSPGLTAEDDYARVSVTAWMVMALESVRLSGIELPAQVLPRAREFLELSFDQKNGWFRYNHEPSRLRSAWPTLPASTPAGGFCLQLLGAGSDDAKVQAAVGYTVERRPDEYRPYDDEEFVLRGQGNVYFWYYGSLCCFLAGGDAWQRWNERLRTVLPAAQSADGSFAPIDVYAREAGDSPTDRSYTTAMCVLSLEVYYRYFTPLLLGR